MKNTLSKMEPLQKMRAFCKMEYHNNVNIGECVFFKLRSKDKNQVHFDCLQMNIF